jgi:signal transduction histidine kinase
MAFNLQKLSGRRELIVLALMLEFLHLTIWVDFGGPLSRSFMLIHLGLFLLWQPVWRSDERISWQNTLAFFVLTLACVAFLDWWLLFGWLLILCGFAGGRVIINRRESHTYLLVLLFLTLELILGCTPQLFGIPITAGLRKIFSFALPVLPIVLVTLPAGRDDRGLQTVDIIHAFATATLIAVLIFGSLLKMYLGGTDYPIALAQVLITIGLFLFIISWLLTPKAGFTGLMQLWSRSLLNIGTPFEKWLTNLANLSLQRNTPSEFLQAAMEDLITLPWIVGVQWHTDGTSSKLGDTSLRETEFKTPNFTVIIYSTSWLGGALYLHSKLLIQLIDNFYIGKLREKQLTQQAHLKAIHETGARVTHDIKNLLQSLHAITAIIQHDQTEMENRSVSQRLLERQMPYLTQRLQLALDKLQAPGAKKMEEAHLSGWWNDLTNRHELRNIEFNAAIEEDLPVPVDLFDSAVENMLENLKEKSRLDDDLRVSISVRSKNGEIQLWLTDSGKRIPGHIVKGLLKEPVKSDSGLGIGLYQVARLAQFAGYTLTLKDNEDGNVCFELSNVKRQAINLVEAGRK